jgi:hypothetical protein
LGLEDFGGAWVLAGDVLAGPLVGLGERVFLNGYVVRFPYTPLWKRRRIDRDGRRVKSHPEGTRSRVKSPVIIST